VSPKIFQPVLEKKSKKNLKKNRVLSEKIKKLNPNQIENQTNLNSNSKLANSKSTEINSKSELNVINSKSETNLKSIEKPKTDDNWQKIVQNKIQNYIQKRWTLENLSLFVIIFTIFLDLLGVGLVLPILPTLFDSSKGIFGTRFDIPTANIFYGFLIASYPMSQLFGAPILGYLSDIYGRKKVLLASVIGTIISLLVFALGIHTASITLLLVGRICDGLTGGNLSIAQSVIADISTKENKTHNFGLISVAFAMGFIIGPILGGVLSNSNLLNWFDYTTPYYFAAILSLINCIFIYFFLLETAVVREIASTAKLQIWSSFRQLHRAFAHPKLRSIFIINFLFILAFSLFTNFFPQYLQKRFQFDATRIANLIAYVMFWVVLSQAVLMRFLLKKLNPQQILSLGLFGTGFFLIMLILPTDSTWFLVILPLVAIAQGITIPNITTILSNAVSDNEQGEIMGINQSVQAFATIAPVFAGFGVNLWIKFPLVIAAVSALFAWIIFHYTDKKYLKESAKIPIEK